MQPTCKQHQSARTLFSLDVKLMSNWCFPTISIPHKSFSCDIFARAGPSDRSGSLDDGPWKPRHVRNWSVFFWPLSILWFGGHAGLNGKHWQPWDGSDQIESNLKTPWSLHLAGIILAGAMNVVMKHPPTSLIWMWFPRKSCDFLIAVYCWRWFQYLFFLREPRRLPDQPLTARHWPQ